MKGMVFNVENIISQLFVMYDRNFVMMSVIVIVAVVWWIIKNRKLIRNFFNEIFSWWNSWQEKEKLFEMVKEDHEGIEHMKEDIDSFEKNQKQYHQQSIDIRGNLDQKIDGIIETNKTRDLQIQCLINSNRVILGQEINQKYKQYITLDGIPEDEVDEFTDLHAQYKALGGNHSGDAKYDYVMEHLRVIPVETKLVYKPEEV